jgi:hypothetical protein
MLTIWRRTRLLLFVAAIAAGGLLLNPSTSTQAATTCEQNEYCNEEWMRDCSGGSACGCSGCHSDREICCLDPIIVN